MQPDGARRSILTQIEGRRLNAPNDICFDAKGGFYFSDPAWAARTPEGVARAEHSPPGDISYVAPDSRASRVALDLLFPNGLCVSPDGQSLIVAETGTGRVLSYAIGRNGALYSPNTLIELRLESGLDGMAFDADGRLLIAGWDQARSMFSRRISPASSIPLSARIPPSPISASAGRISKPFS